MNETNIKIEKLRDKIRKLEHEIVELEAQNSNYYIGVYSIGDGDYWDEYYCRLGYTTESRAKDWVNRTYDEEGIYEARYFPVTEERYDKYGDWFNLDKLRKSINRYCLAISNLEGIDAFEATIDKAIEDIAKEIGIKYLSFMHPGN